MKKSTWFIPVGSIAILIIVIVSCSKQLDTSSNVCNSSTHTEFPQQRGAISLMSEDLNCVLLVTDMNNFGLEVEKIINANSLDIEQVRFELENLKIKDLPVEEQFAELQKIFKEDISILINTHGAVFWSNWFVVKEKFGEIDESLLSEACEEVLREKLDREKKMRMALWLVYWSSYSRRGNLSCSMRNYCPCHNCWSRHSSFPSPLWDPASLGRGPMS